ncbi:ABC transporter permease [Actinoplanes sp. NPDC049668]|uniref:ABC transporter permease n=1 Tax=unclassified Actinoplanes TaxID=2626549 RepID=UPI0033A67464
MSSLDFRHPPATIREIPAGTDLKGMVFREFALLTRNRVNFVLSLMPTLVYLLLMNTSLSNLVGEISYRGQILAYEVFLLPMVLMSAILSASLISGMALFQEEMSGVSTELWSYPLRRSSYLAGKILVGVGVVVLQAGLALVVGLLVLGVSLDLSNWIALGVMLVVTAAAFNAFYLIVALLISDFQLFNIITNTSLSVLLFASPSLYTVDDMPQLLRWISVVNPVTYGVTGMRDATAFGFGAIGQSLLVLGVLAPVSYMAASAALLRRASRM